MVGRGRDPRSIHEKKHIAAFASSSAPLRLELLHDLEELIVRVLLVLQALFEFSQVCQRLLLAKDIVRRRLLRPGGGRHRRGLLTVAALVDEVG